MSAPIGPTPAGSNDIGKRIADEITGLVADLVDSLVATRPTVDQLTDELCDQMHEAAERAAAIAYADARTVSTSPVFCADVMRAARRETYRSFLAQAGLLAPPASSRER
jgi:hypothetical protein